MIAGRPNVGKSRLLNALCGFSRAIVDSTPGTTRDVIAFQTALAGWPVELVDTAGLRSTPMRSRTWASSVHNASLACRSGAAGPRSVSRNYGRSTAN